MKTLHQYTSFLQLKLAIAHIHDSTIRIERRIAVVDGLIMCANMGGQQRFHPKTGIINIANSPTIMKKMIIDSIKQLKRDRQVKAVEAEQLNKTQQKMKDSPKRNKDSSDLHHRQKGLKSTGSIFKGFTFCFPIVDLELTPKQIDLLSNSITQEGGRVLKFIGRPVSGTIDFVAINPKQPLEPVQQKIKGKLAYKEIIDYHFVTESVKAGRIQNFERFSLYINIEELEAEAQEVKKQEKPSKMIKMDEQIQDNDSNITVRLSEDSPHQASPKKEQSQRGKQEKQSHNHQQKIDIQELMMHQQRGHFSINAYIADELTKLMKIYATERDLGRKMAYMKAASVIRGLDKEIQSEKDVENLRGIGDKIAKKIKELLTTGKINKLQSLQGEEKNVARGKLSEVWGVGPSKANELYGLGIKTIEDMRKRTDLLNRNQKIGLKYFEQFQEKIPREKITRMYEFVRNVIETIVPSLDMYRIEVCGSYRRGKKECGDMDVIISRKDGVYQRNFLTDLVRELQGQGFLTDHLTHPKPSEDRSVMSYMGVCKFQGPSHHRIDIKYYPIEEFAYAILYFTGSGAFNRMLRLHTMKLGLTLSDKGATPKMQKGVIWDKPIPICLTEEDIFNFLGLEYKTPQQRDI